jgi:hypothetical protein
MITRIVVADQRDLMHPDADVRAHLPRHVFTI